MKLPGGAEAIVDLSKLRDYCLDPHHPRAGTKPASSLQRWVYRRATPILSA
jgi:hypothetical protein